LGFLCWVRTLCQRVSSTRGGIGVAARRPCARVFGAHARNCVGVRPLLSRHHGFELQIFFYHSHRFLTRDYGLSDCCGMAFREANPKPLVACWASARVGNTEVTDSSFRSVVGHQNLTYSLPEVGFARFLIADWPEPQNERCTAVSFTLRGQPSATARDGNTRAEFAAGFRKHAELLARNFEWNVAEATLTGEQ
jgi:hypothetical protein